MWFVTETLLARRLLQQLKESPSKTNATLQGPGKIIMAHDAIQVSEVGVYCDPVLGLTHRDTI